MKGSAVDVRWNLNGYRRLLGLAVDNNDQASSVDLPINERALRILCIREISLLDHNRLLQIRERHLHDVACQRFSFIPL